ncbi:MAG: GIY-YIG nuclease family protein [Planktothrix sp. GU0601_MAG3]|nr:MAG: GIY-YIG nuclease family protein [Planktothrix sp. GU0601_MAG3]
MTTPTEIPSLNSLDYISYLDENGKIPESLQGEIGVYAIFNQEKNLKYVGYSRNIYFSLKQHFIRQNQDCYWLKLQTIERPSRTILEEIQKAWIDENGSIPLGNGEDKSLWNDPIQVRPFMTPEEQDQYQKTDDIGKEKLLKQAARRVEEQILSELKARGLQEEIRFNPKLKTSGLLDLK